MIELNNKHIVLIFIIIIVGVFIYNYDVYVIAKNEPLCKPIYITKREISPKIRAELNKTESFVLKDTFSNLSKSGYLENFSSNKKNSEGFSNLSETNSQDNFDVPPKSFSSFTISSITNPYKIKVIDSVIKILSYIPTNYCESQIKQLVEYFAIIYETSPDLESFYKNVASSTKIKEDPYNSKYSHLILFLIGKFDNDYKNCNEINQNQNEQCAMIELLGQIIKSNPSNLEPDQSNQSDQSNQPNQPNQSNQPNQPNQPDQSNQPNQPDQISKSDYLESELNTLIEQNKITPERVINIIKKAKNIPSQQTQSDTKVILPTNEQPPNNYKENIYDYLNEQHKSISNVPVYNPSNPNQKYPNQKYPNQKYPNQKYPNQNQNQCNGPRCTYKCDSSYSNAISYLDQELKPLESFGNIGSNYAPF